MALFDLLGSIGVLLSLAVDIRELLKWLNDHRETPQAKAFDATVEAFQQDLPNIRHQLAAFLCSQEVHQVIRQVILSDNPSVEWLEEELMTRSIYFGSDIDQGMARALIQSLLRNLDKATLDSGGGLYYHDQKELIRHQKIVTTIQEGTASVKAEVRAAVQQGLQMTTQALSTGISDTLEPKWKERIARYKQRTEESGPKSALVLWEDFLQDVRTLSDQNRDVEFEILTNIAACHWQLGNASTARDFFVEAYRQKPEEKRAVLNRALAYMIDSRMLLAHEMVDTVLADFPSDAKALAVKANLLISEKRLTEIVTLFSPFWSNEFKKLTFESPDCCRMLGIALIDLDLFDEATSVLEHGLALDGNDSGLKVLLGVSLANETILEPKHRLSVGEESITKLRRAEGLLSEAISAFERLGNDQALPEALNVRAGVRMRLGKLGEGYADAERAHSLAGDNENIRRNFVLFGLATDHMDASIEVLEKWASESGSNDVLSLLVDVYSSLNRDDLSGKVRALIETHWPATPLEELPIEFLEAYGKFLASIGDDLVNQVADAIQKTKGNNPLVHLLRAKASLRKGNISSVVPYLEVAKKYAVDQGDLTTLAEIGGLYYDIGEWIGAADTLGLVNVTSWSPRALIRRYLVALHNCHSHKFEDIILTLAGAYRKARGTDPVITQAEIAVLESRGDFSSAANLWDQLSLQNSAEPLFKLGQSRCLLRMGRTESARRVLSSLGTPSDLDAHTLMVIAHMYSSLDEEEDALDWGYEAWCKGRGDQQLNLGYISLFLGQTRRDSGKYTVDVITEGTAATLDYDDHSKHTWLIAPPAKLSLPEALPSNAELAIKLLGHRVGDVVRVDTASGPKTCTIKDIRHRYVWAFQTALQTYPARFPGDKALQAFTVDDDLKAILGILDNHHEAVSRAVGNYRSSALPFATLAKLLGREVFEVWSSIVGSSGEIQFHFCNNTPPSRMAAQEALAKAEAIVFDTLSLLSAHHTGLTRWLPKTSKRLIVPHQVVEDLRQCRKLLDSQAEGRSLLGKNDQGYFFQEIPSDAIKSQIQFLDDILEFCESHTEQYPRPRQYDDFEEGTLVPVIGHEFVVPILIAQDLGNAVYYCDDAPMSDFILRHYGVSCINSSTVLEHGVDGNTISQEIYADGVLKLVRSNYKNTPISLRLLKHTALTRLNPYNDDFQRLLDIIFSPNTERTSALRLSILFCRELLLEVQYFGLSARYLRVFLERIIRSFGMAGVDKFHSEVARQGMILIPNVARANDFIQRWKQAGPFALGIVD